MEQLFYLYRTENYWNETKEICSKRIPHGVIAIRKELWADPIIFRYAVSICSPKDNFNKKLGRIKALNRLDSDKQSSICSTEKFSNISLQTVVNHRMGLINTDVGLEKAIKDSSERWKDFVKSYTTQHFKE